jgi:endonuclease/exonuclease/phosphatase family metal-dependent hydrolase
MERDHFKVGSFNVYNLQLPGQFYYDRTYSNEVYARKVTWLAGQLQRMDADVLGLQEVFNIQALQDALVASGLYDQAEVRVAGDNANGPNLGLVSRFPIATYDIISDFPKQALLEMSDSSVPLRRFSRPVIKARIQINPGLKITFFVIHLKSKRPLTREGVDPHDPLERALGHARSLIVRTAEAVALRYLLLDELLGTNQPVMVMGDFNDDGGAVTSRIITGTPPWRRLPREQKEKIWDVLLYNVKEIQDRRSYRDVYYTHLHNGFHESLDHILVSQEFVVENPNRLGQVEYVANLNDHLIDDTLSDEHVQPWQTDHGQVVVTIRLRERR